MDSEEEHPQNNQHFKNNSEEIARKPKFRKKTENVKKGRLIVRNLSYKVTEKSLRDEFEKYGKVSEVNLLKKADGKLVGCAFIQYFDYNSSIACIKALHGKDFLKRKITVDFAVSKNRYQTTHKDDEEIKKEDPEIKEESDTEKEEVKEENEIKEEDDDENNKDTDKDENSENDESEDEEDDDDNKKEESIEEVKNEKKYTDDRIFTVFIKNLSFDTTNDDLLEFFKKFGPVKYALVVRDSVSGHSKGTGFVRFLRKESVEVCLAQSNKLILQDFPIEILPSVSKQTAKDIENVKLTKKTEPKDTRNLFLLREGMVLAGSASAEGVSATDMSKRLRLEQIKSSMLKNLTRFISRERLTIHNLPEHYDDEKLRKTVIARTKLKPIECRVMRENKPTPAYPKGKPKGFGFISFKRHEDALMVLRKLNNNPEVFSANHRPIVSFSIEDMKVLKIKERRKVHSMLNNPTYQKKMEKLKAKKMGKKKEKKDKKPEVSAHSKSNGNTTTEQPDADEAYSGFAAKPGAFVKLRGTFKLKEQSKIHEKSMKERNKKLRREKHLSEIQQEKKEKKLDRTKAKRKIDTTTDSLSMKIDKYKNLIKSSEEPENKKFKTRGKWFMD